MSIKGDVAMENDVKNILIKHNKINYILINIFNIFYSFIAKFLLPCALISNLLLILFMILNGISYNIQIFMFCFISLFAIRIICKKTP